MTDTLTALTSAKDVLDTLMFQSWIRPNWTQSISEAAMKLESDIASLTEPFDPAKHLDGWVKEREDTWNLYAQEGFHSLRMSPYTDGKWQLVWQKNMSIGSATLFAGQIKTHAFFALLCGALNIK